MDKQDFLYNIVATLAEHPEWLPEAFEAITEGARAANETLYQRLGTMRTGLIASMSLISPKRMSEDMKRISSDLIRKAYEVDGGTKGLAPCEYKAFEKMKELTSED